ncbi:GspE/PulE family protein [Hydrogenibacillus sp. N12]|uniref:GspE/PulE family protein n=1 Tax=Hydrogenibacillus sp. N12 TaxID=2866627 RepID=UPI001C7D67E5|nr:GspE/PulE family protein [Hydrogenibacillus sp. N12]QZA32928.1 GspE/PulE family protein [Hydrogenibacillus sp. N12]
MTVSRARLRLGDLLLQSGAITEEALAEALAEQRRTKERLGDILIRRGLITPEALYAVLEKQLGIPHVRLSRQALSPALAQIVPEALARKYRVIPYDRQGNVLSLAMVDPLDYYAIDDIELITGLTVRPALISPDEFAAALARLYGPESEVVEEMAQGEEALREEEIYDEASPIVRFVTQTIERAVRLRASDIHFDPFAEGATVRFRIDGKLRREQTISRRVMQMVAARIKIVSDLNIAERRRPQDGRFRLVVDGREIDIRVSVLPTLHGEKIVLRLLDQSRGVRRVEDLGLAEDNFKRLVAITDRPSGMVLITGPTGSGKSTTLYALLDRLNQEARNIITIEDPVEYEIEGINQVNVNPQAGLTFASGLRAILRQDPNIIMVGEIRDLETAEIAVRAALTGHLVLSTLHTNDAVGAVDRLRDMGIPSYLIAAALNGVVAQRLVRRICPECRTRRKPAEEEALVLGRFGYGEVDALYRGGGCPTCGFTGYYGRLAVHEVFVLDERAKRMIAEGAEAQDILQHARARGMRRLIEDALEKVVAGETTLEEVFSEIGFAGFDEGA